MSQEINQKSRKQPCQASGSVLHERMQVWHHEWQPLFKEPLCAEDSMSYITHRLADYKQCSRCGAIGMEEGTSIHRTLLLGDYYAERKKREALVWNARQQASKEAG